MTTFEKPVKRVTVGEYNVLYSGRGRRKPIVVTLKTVAGDDMIEFREKGSRGRWLLPVDAGFLHCIKRDAFKLAMDKAKKRAERRRANRRK